MGRVFNGTTPNLNWAVNMLNRSNQGILDSIGGIIAGGGSIATNEKVEAACQWLINKATNNYITYSQTNRNLKNPNGMSYDCSSFIITGFYAVGWNINASATSNMRMGFTSAGFVWIPGTVFPAEVCRRGDILLKESNHTQMYIGDNQDVNCGSTPAMVQPHSDDNYGRGWDGILRYQGT